MQHFFIHTQQPSSTVTKEVKMAPGDRTYESNDYLHCRRGLGSWICLQEQSLFASGLWVNRDDKSIGSLKEMEQKYFPPPGSVSFQSSKTDTRY